MLKLVWDASAILNFGELNQQGYSPSFSLWKDISGWTFPHKHIYASHVLFEIARCSYRRENSSEKELGREFYVFDENSVLYPIDDALFQKSRELIFDKNFGKLKSLDLIHACIAKLEGATLVTLDGDFSCIQDEISVLNLNSSRESAVYRQELEKML